MKNFYYLLLTLAVCSMSYGHDMVITGVFDGSLSGGTPKLTEVYVINDIADLSTYGIGTTAGNAATTVSRVVTVEMPPCDSTPSSNDGAGISAVSFNGIDFTSGGDITYEDFTATAVEAGQSTTASLSITFATGYGYDTHVWVDLNDDNNFDSSELLYSGESLPANPTTLDASFLVPASAPLGDHRVRIGTADTGQATPDPCYSGSYGVTIELTMTVVAPPSCFAPSALTASNITDSSADISWTADASQSLFNVEVVDITAGGSVTGTPTLSGVANPYALTGLTANNDYEFYVQADCGGGDLSTWSGPASFYTGHCVPSSSSSSTYINSFSTTGANVNVDNASTGYTNSGYGDYSQDTPIETFPGGSFDFSASIVGGTAGFALWIDLNNDLVFDTTSEVLFNTTSYQSGPFTGTIEIPSDLAEGNYRLRMMTDYNDLNPSEATGDSACSFDSGFFGGFQGEVEDYTVTLVAAPADAMDWNNLQWLQPTADGNAGSRTSVTVDPGTSITAYAQGYEGGVTDTTVGSAGAGIECWIGIHNENTDPATWPASAWSGATFDSEQNNNDEYKLTTTDAPVGTNYVASRWRLNNAGYTYGGTNPSGSGDTPGGPWDGTTNVSIQLVVNPIANDDCSSAIALTVNSDLECGTVTSGSVEFATDSGSTNTCSMFAHADDDVWYSFVATSESHVVSLSNVSGSYTDLYHALYAGDCNTLGDPIKCSDSNTSETTGLTIGNTYYVQVYTYTATAGQNTSFDICVGTPPPPPTNDNCSGVIDLASLTSPVSGSTTYASNDFILGCLSSSSAKDVIYSIQVPDGATLSIGQTSNAYDSKHSLRYGNTCPGDQLIVCTDDSDIQTETWENNTGADQTVYWIQSAYSGSGDYTLAWTMTPLSIDDQTLKQFTYFPNPVNDMLTIRAQKDVDDITVYNMLGQVVKQQTPNTMDCTVDLSAMQSGAYFVQISIDNTVETVRVLKN